MLLFCTSDGRQLSSVLLMTNQVSSVLDMMNQVSELLVVDVISELLSSAEQDMGVVSLVWRGSSSILSIWTRPFLVEFVRFAWVHEPGSHLYD